MYVVIWNDRHTDIDVEVFTDRQAALDRAQAIEAGYVVPEVEPGDEFEPDDEDLRWTRLSGEGDYVRVVVRKLNQPWHQRRFGS